MISAVPLATTLGYDPLVFGLIILLTSTPILIRGCRQLHLLFWNATDRRLSPTAETQEYALYLAPRPDDGGGSGHDTDLAGDAAHSLKR